MAEAPKPDVRTPLPEGAFCPDCSYDLRGSTSDRCPECGGKIDAFRATSSQLPWTRRGQLGVERAYWRTVAVVMFRQKHFRNEIVRPVDYGAAQRFRWATILHLALPVLVVLLILHITHAMGAFQEYQEEVPIILLGWVWPGLLAYVALIMFLLALTGIPSYFFQGKGIPVRQQNRAIALSYYASGPIALTPIALAALGLSWMLTLDRGLGLFFFLLGLILPWALTGIWWLDLIHLTRRILPQHKSWAAVVGVCVPLLWLAAALLVGSVLAGAAYIWLIVVSPV